MPVSKLLAAYFSILIYLQLVVDNKLLIRDTYVRWPGSTHDARVLRNSDLFDKEET